MNREATKISKQAKGIRSKIEKGNDKSFICHNLFTHTPFLILIFNLILLVLYSMILLFHFCGISGLTPEKKRPDKANYGRLDFRVRNF